MKVRRFYGVLALCALMWFAAPLGFAQDKPFVTEWNIKADNLTVTFPGEGNFKLKIKAKGATAYLSEVTVTGAAHYVKKTETSPEVSETRHKITFPAAGIYVVEASGLTKIYARGIDAKEKDETLILVKSWGDAKWTSLNNGFEGYKSLRIDPEAGKPNLGGVTSLSRLFASCWLMDSPTLKDWDVSKITNFNALFSDCRAFNQDLSGWDIAAATDLGVMFAGCSVFQQDLSAWKDKVAKCTTMQAMFNQAKLFNGNVSEWNVGNVTNMKLMFSGSAFDGNLGAWDVSKVTDMTSMFEGATQFKGVGLENWKVDNVETMERMFKDASEFNGNVTGWKVSKVKIMDDLFEDCEKFNHSVKDWDLTRLVKEGTRKIGLQNVDYNEALFDELLITWSSRKDSQGKPIYSNENGAKPGLYIQSTGLYYSENLIPLVNDLKLKKTGRYAWTIEARPDVKGMFRFTPSDPIALEMGHAQDMPSFEGRFLSHRELVMSSSSSSVRLWKVFDGVSDGEKINQAGGESDIYVNRDFNVVAIFRDNKVKRPEKGKHFVRVYVYGSGSGKIEGKIGGVDVPANGGVFQLANDKKAKVGDYETETLKLTADENSAFRYYMVRFENNAKQEEDTVWSTSPEGVKTHVVNRTPMGYYRFGGTGTIEVKIPKSVANDLSIDIVFESKEMQQNGEYNLYFSAAGPGKIDATETIGTGKPTALQMGKNTIPLDGKIRKIKYKPVNEKNAVIDRILVFEKDFRIHGIGVGKAKIAVAYRPLRGSGQTTPGEDDEPNIVPIDSRSLKVKVSGVVLEGMTIDLNGVGTKENPYIWYTGKVMGDAFGEPGQPKLIFTPANASQKGVTWKFQSTCPDTYSASGIALAEKEGCLIKCTGEAVGKKGETVVLIAKIKNKSVERFSIGHQEGIPPIWGNKNGAAEGIELGKSFFVQVEPQPADAYNRKYTISFSPADAVEKLSEKDNVTWYKAVKPTEEVTMTIVSDEKGKDGKPVATRTEKFKIWKVDVTGIEFINPPTEPINLGENELQVQAVVLPQYDPKNNVKGATIDSVAYSVSDATVLQPDKNNPGLYKLLKGGTCDITATSVDNPTFTAKITVTVVDPSQAVEDVIFAGVVVAPNPFEGQLSVRNGALRGSYELMSVSGQVLRRGALEADVTTFETRDLVSGAYLLRLTAEGVTKTYRVVKK